MSYIQEDLRCHLATHLSPALEMASVEEFETINDSEFIFGISSETWSLSS